MWWQTIGTWVSLKISQGKSNNHILSGHMIYDMILQLLCLSIISRSFIGCLSSPSRMFQVVFLFQETSLGDFRNPFPCHMIQMCCHIMLYSFLYRRSTPPLEIYPAGMSLFTDKEICMDQWWMLCDVINSLLTRLADTINVVLGTVVLMINTFFLLK